MSVRRRQQTLRPILGAIADKLTGASVSLLDRIAVGRDRRRDRPLNGIDAGHDRLNDDERVVDQAPRVEAKIAYSPTSASSLLSTGIPRLRAIGSFQLVSQGISAALRLLDEHDCAGIRGRRDLGVRSHDHSGGMQEGEKAIDTLINDWCGPQTWRRSRP